MADAKASAAASTEAMEWTDRAFNAVSQYDYSRFISIAIGYDAGRNAGAAAERAAILREIERRMDDDAKGGFTTAWKTLVAIRHFIQARQEAP